MGVRLLDIAEKTGYSINTVSRALNGKNNVTPETKAEIEKCAKEMGYVANFAAKKLRSGVSKSIALIFDNFINPKNAILTDEISLYLAKFGYTVNIYTSNGDEKQEKAALHSAISMGNDGIIISPVQEAKAYEAVIETGIPVVFLEDRLNTVYNWPFVAYDENRVGYLAAEHLIRNGKNNIMVVEYSNSSKIDRRIEGVKAGCYMNSRDFNDANTLYLPYNIRSMDKILAANTEKILQCDGIICNDDYIAMHIMELLHKNEVKIPEDTMLVGFGNIQARLFSKPLLTTVCGIVSGEMSEKAVDLLLELINGGKKRDVTLSVMLYARET